MQFSPKEQLAGKRRTSRNTRCTNSCMSKLFSLPSAEFGDANLASQLELVCHWIKQMDS